MNNANPAIDPGNETTDNALTDNWVKVLPLGELEQKRVCVVRPAGKQIALFLTDAGVRACNNRCPHEGFPLAEGSVGDDCSLTCNWHNWKFDLATGANAYGGDRLRVYPVEIRDGSIWLDLTDPPLEERLDAIRGNLHDAFVDHDYARIAREIARLMASGGDPLDALRLAIEWSWQKFEFGWTHAYAGMADWVELYAAYPDDAERQLACLVEAVAHTAHDTLREDDYPLRDDARPFDEEAFVDAIERADEASAVAYMRGGLTDGLQFPAFERALTRAALAHYNAFGHSLIYVTKAAALIAALGPRVAEPLLLSLVRHIVYAAREDKIPEFRGMAVALEAWGDGSGDGVPDAAAWRRLGINKALEATVAAGHQPPLEVFRALLHANAQNLLHFDVGVQDQIKVSISNNVGWLDFTHGLTFGHAVYQQCTRFPELWPQALLQMACFCGRNAAYTDFTQPVDQWLDDDVAGGLERLIARLPDHGQDEYIVSVHWLKTLLSSRALVNLVDAELAKTLYASVNRFINSPNKRRHALRTAHQSLAFVAKDL